MSNSPYEKKFEQMKNHIKHLEAAKTELLTCIKYNMNALQEAIMIAPVDKLPCKAGTALQDSQYYYEKYTGM